MNYLIDGRRFRPVGENTTLRHDLATQALIQRANLGALQLGESETPDDYALRMFRTALDRTDVLLLIAHLIVDEDMKNTEWTPAVSAELASYLGAITEESEKVKVRGILVGALSSFLSAGLVFAVRSLRSSLQADNEDLPQ